jgi:hypothetical protein
MSGAILFAISVRHFIARRRSKTSNRLPEPETTYPPLDTTYLLEMPAWAVERYYGGQPSPGTFSTRWCHLVVSDRDGRVYVGFIVRETMKSLRASGFTQSTYYVPLCGPGEMLGGDPLVTQNGGYHEVYPFWLGAKWEPLEGDPERYHELDAEYHRRGEPFGLAWKRHFKGEDITAVVT